MAPFYTFLVFILAFQYKGVSQNTDDPMIRISANNRYFTDGMGGPLFLQGDTEWELFHSLTTSEAKELLLARKKQGFNFIQVMITGVPPESATNALKIKNRDSAWLNNNPLTPNEIYFRRADSVISFAENLGIILAIGVYHAQDQDHKRINKYNARPWAKWLTSRYKKARNIVWSMYPHADTLSHEVISQTVGGILEGDKGRNLITMHPDPSPYSSSFMHDEKWLSFNTLQTFSTGFINYNMVWTDYGKTPFKPVVNGEARYETESNTTAFESRRPGYWSILAGGSYVYGHGNNWISPRTWRDWYASPGAFQISVMANFFRSIAWWKLKPDQQIFESSREGNAAAYSEDGSQLVVYLTLKEPAIVHLNRITSSKKITGWQIDPRTGARKKLGTFSSSASPQFSIPEGQEDVLLFFEKEN